MITPPRRRWTKSQMVDTGPVYLTPEGIKRLHAKLARLKKDLPDIINEAARTAAYGDRSDNAEYKEAKGILRRTQGQIWRIEDELKRIVEIPEGKSNSGTVQIGSAVILESVSTENKKIRKMFRILGPSESDPLKGLISHKSPLGMALLNHKTGDRINIQIPKGIQVYTIVEIS